MSAPVRFRSVKPATRAHVLNCFPRYYRGRPALARITVTNYPTQRNAWTALMRDDIDMLYEVSRDAAGFVEGGNDGQFLLVSASLLHSSRVQRP